MTFKPGRSNDIEYYGNSDLIAQIADELQNRPDSCFAENCLAWYNSLYSELSESVDCKYQEQIDGSQCEDSDNEPETLTDVIDVLTGFVQGNGIRVARATLRIICREAQRQVIETRSSDVN